MKEHIFKYLLLINCLLLIPSCDIDDISQELVSTELKVFCFLTDYSDSSSLKKVWIGCTYDGYYVRGKNYIGHCWNYNTDTLPTLLSEIRKVTYVVPNNWIQYSDYIGVTDPIGKELFKTGIPVSESDVRLTVRGFIIFNDSLIRYSDPLTLNNPSAYAN